LFYNITKDLNNMNDSYYITPAKTSHSVAIDNTPAIDFRSDTVTKPSAQMRQLMAEAIVGDDVYGEDPTINALQMQAAQLLDKEAGLFVPSGTMSNLLALMSHCQRGDEVIVGDQNHIFSHEAGGASALGGIVMQSIATTDKGYISAEQIERAIRPNDSHFAQSKLICLENTVSGFIQPEQHFADILSVAKQHQLSTHLDGARLMHAAVASAKPAALLAQGFDSVSLCLSKGLGAPAGSVLLGSTQFIARATRLRKMLGGGMRQAGILAAAGSYALNNNVARLADDHQLAQYFACELNKIAAIEITVDDVETNMLFAHFPVHTTAGSNQQARSLAQHLMDHNICISPAKTCRLVIHMDISKEDVEQVLTLIKGYYSA
jgi:threonine aldolase